ncbi:MAG: phenylalanine--tRNA ligase subunit alpha [Candidatus Omnitrophica bacterium]|nr:phenylalanine--tRNA ligase subunit alpha [Candidatus Omnitrophota bacterium]
MKDRIKETEVRAFSDIKAVVGQREALEALRIKYLGRKGEIAELFKGISSVATEDKAEVGRLLNELKVSVTSAIEGSLLSSSNKTLSSKNRIDVTLPGIPARLGKLHPITQTIDRISDIFIGLGFRVVEGPEIETEHYNFEALNIPLEHPSRDAFDTFYLESLGGKNLLRSHTSPVQARFMEKNKPPFSIIVPGKVYRPDATDASHSFMFHQVEGLCVGKEIHFSDLKGCLETFAKEMFGSSTKMRLRPSFFPFTEPSAEVDISCIICGGAAGEKRCSVCGGKGWLEILGAGMVNPKVFEKVGYDPRKLTGFAFGMGVERIAMLKYGINDIRMFYENDERFLRQF